MRLRVRLKSIALLSLSCLCIGLYSYSGSSVRSWRGEPEKTRRVARISGEDLQPLRGYPWQAPAPATVSTAPTKLSLNDTLSALPKGEANGPPCDRSCQFRRLREQTLVADAQIQSRRQQEGRGRVLSPPPSAAGDQKKTTSMMTGLAKVRNSLKTCDRACRIAKLKNSRAARGGYSSRVQVENVTLPESWTVTRELVDRLTARRRHVKDVCQKYGLDRSSENYQPNAWEFLVNEDYGLVWCNVFKAASSTWFYNFNLLAGFTETELLHAKDTPIQLARKKYPRPSVDELYKAMNSTPEPLSFMIVRHPLQRLVSGYRDKILSGSRFYSKLARTIIKQYPELGPGQMRERPKSWAAFGKTVPRSMVPSFPQFVQFLIDEAARGQKLDEHWTPMSQFCTPCLVDFDVFAKVETLEEDGNYIIFTAGIEDVIKPKRINRSRNEPTDAVADKFLCQLSSQQMKGLLQLYKYDLELFEYDASKYVNCTVS